jgi:hypothetical protein
MIPQVVGKQKKPMINLKIFVLKISLNGGKVMIIAKQFLLMISEIRIGITPNS